MSIEEMIDILEYELDRMKDERGSDYSGVRALEQLLALLSRRIPRGLIFFLMGGRK